MAPLQDAAGGRMLRLAPSHRHRVYIARKQFITGSAVAQRCTVVRPMKESIGKREIRAL